MKNMQEALNLGTHWVSDFLSEGEEPRGGKHELKLMLTDDGNLRLETTIPRDKMFGEYYYRSGLNATMRKELKDVVDSITNVYNIKDNGLWIDLASNDGYLLSNVNPNCIRVGIDPADDTYKVEAEQHSNLIIQDYFSASVFKNSKYGHLKASVITCCAMLYDIENIDPFLQDILEISEPNALFVCQLSWTPAMLTACAFDNIVSEHIYYYSLFNLKTILERNNFKILDVTLNACNGGSFRVFAMPKNGNEKLFANQAHRDIAKVRIDSLLAYEKTLNLDQISTWQNFQKQIEDLKEKTVSFIRQAKKNGKSIWALGASTKGSTLLQVFGLNENDIDGIAERNPEKIGLRTPGSNIKIFSEEDFRKANPDYVLILIWPFINEIIDRESEYLKKGGSLVVPCPKFEVIKR